MGCGAGKPKHDASERRQSTQKIKPDEKGAQPDKKPRVPKTSNDAVLPSASPVAKPDRGKIRGHPINQPSRSVQWYVAWSDAPFDIVAVDLEKGEHKEASFLDRHPGGEVPVLEDGDFSVSESTAILQYLAHDNPQMMPQDAKKMAQLRAYMGRHADTVRKCSDLCFRRYLQAPNDEQAVKDGFAAIKPTLDYYNSILETNDYILGDSLSLADFLFAPEVDQLHFPGLNLLSNHPHIVDYFQRLRECIGGYADNVNLAQKEVKKMSFITKVTGHPMNQGYRAVELYIASIEGADGEDAHCEENWEKDVTDDVILLVSAEAFEAHGATAVMAYLTDGFASQSKKERAVVAGFNAEYAELYYPMLFVDCVVQSLREPTHLMSSKLHQQIEEKGSGALSKLDSRLQTVSGPFFFGESCTAIDFLCITLLDMLVAIGGLQCLDKFPACAGYIECFEKMPVYVSEKGRMDNFLAKKRAKEQLQNAESHIAKNVDSNETQPLLQHHIGSPGSKSVIWLLTTLGLSVKRELVVRRSDAPRLIDGEVDLSDPAAILVYLSCGTLLEPPSPKARALVHQYFGLHMNGVHDISRKIKQGTEVVAPILQKYDELLSTQQYIAGDNLSLADFLFAPEIEQLNQIDESALGQYTKLNKYLSRLDLLPAYASLWSECNGNCALVNTE
ncbi:hypothetical protein DIPPA_70170 [Diplonema papillatum]|nr:hypothetical protein DIPPA_70170 [Diplonema papillatum]